MRSIFSLLILVLSLALTSTSCELVVKPDMSLETLQGQWVQTPIDSTINGNYINYKRYTLDLKPSNPCLYQIKSFRRFYEHLPEFYDFSVGASVTGFDNDRGQLRLQIRELSQYRPYRDGDLRVRDYRGRDLYHLYDVTQIHKDTLQLINIHPDYTGTVEEGTTKWVRK